MSTLGLQGVSEKINLYVPKNELMAQLNDVHTQVSSVNRTSRLVNLKVVVPEVKTSPSTSSL